MLQLHSFAAVKATMAPIFKKLSLLLAILLCSALAFMVPATVQAAPATETDLSIHTSDEATFSVAAGEVSAGETEGVLQKTEQALFSPLSKVVLQLLYPQPQIKEAVPLQHSSHAGAKLLHSILTKGP